jgi:hypothetical protein
MFKAEIHRILQNPIYHGEFIWLGKRYQGSHDPIVLRTTFDAVQAILHRNGPRRSWKRLHPFMGLLTCAKCGCAITAEMKKGKYVYYHCTHFRGDCDNSYIRQEVLSDRLADVIRPIQISTEIADDIAKAIRFSDGDVKSAARRSASAARSAPPRDHVEARSGLRGSARWPNLRRLLGAEIEGVGGGVGGCERREGAIRDAATRLDGHGRKILELARRAENLYKSQDLAEQRRLLETVLSNCTFDSGSVCPT